MLAPESLVTGRVDAVGKARRCEQALRGHALGLKRSIGQEALAHQRNALLQPDDLVMINSEKK